MKKIKLVAFTIMLSMIMVNVNAEEDIVGCLTGTSGTCILNEDVELLNSVDITNDIVLDLNGHKITSSSSWAGEDYLLAVKYGSKLTINDSVGTGEISTTNEDIMVGIKLTVKGETYTDKDANLIVNGGTIKGYSLGISGNGSRNNANVTINGGVVTTYITDDGAAIYFPQVGTLNINGGNIEGCTGIEIRSGNLNVNGGNIKGNYIPLASQANANGTTTKGAGIAVVQHTTLNDINVSIKAGTIEGYTALFEKNLQNNGKEAIDKVKLSITGGTFNAINGGTEVIYSQDESEFITGGIFNKSVESYIGSTYIQSNNTVIPNTKTSDGDVTFESEEPFDNDYYLSVERQNEETVNELSEEVEENFDSEDIKDVTLLALYDITLLNDKSIVTVSDGNYTIYILLNESLRGYDHYKVVYVNDNEIEEIIDATLEDLLLKFNISHLSTYGIVGYNDIETETISDNSEIETISNEVISSNIIANPQTGDNVLVSMIIMFISLIGIISLMLVNKKKLS